MRLIRVWSGLAVLVLLAGPAPGQNVDKDVADVIKKIKDPKTNDFFKAQDCENLARLAGKSDKVVPFLLELLADPKTETMAAKAVGEAGAGRKADLPGMLALLRDVTKAKSREALIVSLDKIGPGPEAFLEARLT